MKISVGDLREDQRSMPNLLKSVQQETEVDLSTIKINAIATIGILFAVGFSLFLSRLYQGFGEWTTNLAATLAFATFFLVVIFLQVILIKDIGRIGTIVFLQTGALLIPFIFHLSGFILIGILLAYLLIFWGSYSGKNELQYSMKVRTFRFAKFILPKAITGLSLFVAASYMSVFHEQGIMVSAETFRRIVLPAESIIKIAMPGVSLEDTFTVTLEKSNPELTELSFEEREAAVEEQRGRIAKLLQYNFESRDTLIDILYNAYIVNMRELSANRRISILFVLGIVLFVLVRSIGAPLSWLVALIATAIYEILLAVGFAVVVLETKSKEIVLLK